MLPGARHNPEISFDQAQKMLYILTGVEPILTTGTIDKYHQGEHLRFVFDGKSASFSLVKTMLKLLNIQHCSELFKNLEPREGRPTLEFYITVEKSQLTKLDRYLAPGAFFTLKNDYQKMQIANLRPEIQAALIGILFDPNFLESLKERNKGQFVLDGLMFYFGKLLINSAPCFTHLKASGIETDFTVLLEVEEQITESTAPAITPALANHGKRSRETVENTSIAYLPESNYKRPAVNK